MDNRPYNPLDKANLGRSVSDALLAASTSPLNDTAHLIGAGVYAIYYLGAFPSYAPIKERNIKGKFAQPIYVGKAVPKGARKGGLSFDASKGTALRDRLRQHASSINDAANLKIEDFYFRSLMVDDIWIPLGENMMIENFRPTWNVIIDGFGNKDPGNRRATQYRSAWDILHPGRKFAVKLTDSGLTTKALTTKIGEFLSGKDVPLIPLEDAVDAGTSNEDDPD